MGAVGGKFLVIQIYGSSKRGLQDQTDLEHNDREHIDQDGEQDGAGHGWDLRN